MAFYWKRVLKTLELCKLTKVALVKQQTGQANPRLQERLGEFLDRVATVPDPMPTLGVGVRFALMHPGCRVQRVLVKEISFSALSQVAWIERRCIYRPSHVVPQTYVLAAKRRTDCAVQSDIPSKCTGHSGWSVRGSWTEGNQPV